MQYVEIAVAAGREPPSRTLAWLLFAAGVAASMLLSAPALLQFGIPYDAPYGPGVAKIHPGSYLLVAAWALAAASHGNPLAVLLRQPRSQPVVAAYLGCMAVVFAWVVYRHGNSGAAYIVQTLWMPAVAMLALDLLGRRRHRQTILLVMGLLACNAALAVGEYLFRVRLVPIPIEQVGTDYFRSTAFLGHPLLNANITIALLPAVLLLPLKTFGRAAFALLLLASVLSFGGRTALVTGLTVYGFFGALYLFNGIARGRYSYLQVTGGGVAIVATLALFAGVVFATGLGDRIFQNLSFDSSASVRAKVWDAFDFLHGSEWWFGVSPAGIDKIALDLGLDPRYESIENFWIYTFLQFGAIGDLPFLVGLGCLVVHLTCLATPAMRLAILVFFGVASTANALSSKTASLTLLATVVFCSVALKPRRTVSLPSTVRAMSPAGWPSPRNLS